ncbi:aldo/keto reductase [Catenulispora acidiphila DSM 44928]|uniref:Aldo/keto reductase n=1 Tax=Catenulispora acidiphila (strain DSM 44928 / JCM 14897 / NBRC 102108 / NRRL B-24433 / ID139908) TaxID=479433 RepID=C7Q6A6_CATAD|nr:aldo/keto reductase [Catenulispora acidiphila]ACU72112.1 aldo/keto reductase [Catenulispora acidiphila DSM 44928]
MTSASHSHSASDSAPTSTPDSTANAAASGTWQLGDRTIHRLGFGAMRLTGTGAFHNGTPRDRATSVAVVRRAVELGVNHIDTAAFYFSALRSANEIVNAALAPFGADEVLVATKVGPRRDRAGGWEDPARPEDLRGDVEQNLRELGRDHLDLVYLRNMGWDSLADHFGALAELREEGLIRNLGVSSISTEQLHETRAIAPVVSVQNKFGLDDTDSLDLLRTCGELGIAFVPFFAIAGSRAGSAEATSGQAPEPEEDRAAAIAEAHGVSPQQIRLAWTLSQGPHVLAIPGTGDLAHLEANITAGAIRLTDDELELLAKTA